VFTVLKVTPLLLMVVFGLQHVTGATLIPGGDLVIEELGSTTLLLIYAYVGFETLGVTAGETSNPRRTLPRAYVGSMLGVSALYFLVVLVYISVIDPLDYDTATLVDVGRNLAGPVGAVVMTLAAVFSIGGNLAASVVAAPRLTFSMAQKQMLPHWFGHIHARYATPDRSILVMGALALTLALSGTFVKLAIASAVVRLLGYIVCIAALPSIRRNANADARRRAFRLKGGLTIPIIALVICFWLLAQSTTESWIAVMILLSIGWLFYAIESRSQTRASSGR
jgi:amino acid transporter